MPYVKRELPPYPCERDVWDTLASESRPIVVYGMGNGADKLFDRFEKYNINVADIFASDGFVRGHSFRGRLVKSFSEIKATYEDFVIVLSFASSRPEVIEMLSEIDSKHEMYIPDMPVAGVDEYFDREFYNSNYRAICSAYNSLIDEESRCLFASVVSYKLTGKLEYLLEAYSSMDERDSLLSKKTVECYVDAGAYNGDTLKEAEHYFGSLERAILIEPDPKNYKRLMKYLDNGCGVVSVAVNAAAWSECGEGAFAESGNRNSSVNSTPSYRHTERGVRLVSVDTLAECQVDFIKYNVEGAEAEALLGSEKTILRDTPTLLVSLYHRSRDIFAIVNDLYAKYGSKYDFYLRRLLSIPAWELDLILLPK